MKFTHDGLTILYGTDDTPAPTGAVTSLQEISVTVGVQPVSPSNVVTVRYQVNAGTVKELRATRLRTDYLTRIEYFRAKFPRFSVGDVVEFVAVCQCAGRQAPDPATAKNLVSSFRVIEQDAERREAPARGTRAGQSAKTDDLGVPNKKPTASKAATEPLGKSRVPSPEVKGDHGGVRPERMSRDRAEKALSESLQAKRKLEREIRELRAKIRALEQRVEKIRRSFRRNSDIEELLNLLKELRSELETKLREQKNLEQIIEKLRRRLDKLEPSIDEPHPQLSDRYPILLFPVRLETRFMGDPGDRNLWVRIYPDQLSIDSHDTELNAEEKEACTLYNERFVAANLLEEDEKKEKILQGWRALVGEVGPNRAAWIHKNRENLSGIFPESYPETPKVRVMPDYFVVRLYQDKDCVAKGTGKRIPDSLPVLWDITREERGDELFDDASRWIIDFNAALNNGMAVKIPLNHLSREQFNKGFTRVIAIGVKTSTDPERGAELLEDLIHAHHYTDGISFLEHGTPTNNTEETSSGHSKTKRDLDHSYDLEIENANPYTKDAERSDAFCLAKALGIDNNEVSEDSIFKNIENAGNEENSYTREMLNALWFGTWGYYITALGQSPKGDASRFREHYINFVRPRGPLPALRIGNLPYGVLPVSKFRNWKCSPDDWISLGKNAAERKELHQIDSYFFRILTELFGKFQEYATNHEAVPRVGATDDPDQELLRILAMEPTAVTHGLRLVVLDEFVEQLAFFMSPRFFGQESIHDIPGMNAYNWVEELKSVWQEGLQENASLLHDITGLEANADISVASPPLLRLIQWELSMSSAPLLVVSPENGEISLSDAGIFIAFVLQGLNLAERLDASEEKNKINLALDDLKKPNNIETVRRLCRDCLGLSSHRLDAWITSLATRRLTAMRLVDEPKFKRGLYIGTFGWVEDLRPRHLAPDLSGLKTETTAVLSSAMVEGPIKTEIIERPTVESAAVTADRRPPEVPAERPQVSAPDGGFIFTHSIGQANAAAVLRSAYISYAEDGVPAAAKLNLTSERVSLALRLIDGGRQGQALGPLLGYQFEQSLHKRSLDQFIDEFRNAFPIQAGKETELAEGETAEAVAARDVVDGLKLASKWHDLDPDSRTPAALSDHLSEVQLDPGLETELDRLVNALDAVNDLFFAEAVFQGTQGKYEHMAAVLDAGAGAGPVPEIQCIRTPRSSLSHSHRVCVLLNDQELPTTIDSRESAEPLLNDWASKVLGDLSYIKCKARIPSLEKETVVNLYDLGISALDFVYMAAVPPTREETELEQLIRYKVRIGHDPVLDAGVEITLDLSDTGDDDLNVELASNPSRNMKEAIEVAHGLLLMIGNATPLNPSMICLPEEAGTEEESEEDVDENQTVQIGVFTKDDYEPLWHRVNGAKNSLYGSGGTSKSVKEDLAGVTDPGSMCDALDRARKFGIQDTIPLSPIDDEFLQKRVENALTEVIKREKKTDSILTPLPVPPEDHDDNEVYTDFDFDRGIRKLCEAMKVLFGSSFTVLPTFRIPNQDEFISALGANVLGELGTERIWLWLQQAAETHPALRRLETATMMADAWRSNPINQEISCEQAGDNLFAINQPLALHVAQFPYRENYHWIGLSKDEITDVVDEESAIEDPPQGCLSLVIHTPRSLDSSQRIGGILIDQWEERIPSNEEVTGISFHYDQPNAQAPQAMLLAVPSEWSIKSGFWRIADLFDTVYDTMDLMKIRTVDLDALRGVGQFLPALYLSPDLPEVSIRPVGILRN